MYEENKQTIVQKINSKYRTILYNTNLDNLFNSQE